MRSPKQPPRQISSHGDYVDGNDGWRVFFIVLLIGAFFGVGVRLFLSPDRVKGWIDEAIANQPAEVALKVSSAHVRLSRGAWPEFAIELRGVELSFAPGCRTQPALTVASLRAPLRIGALFDGRFALGELSAEGLVIDLDEAKERCPHTASREKPVAPKEKPARAPAATAQTPAPKAQPSSPHAWWKPEELAQVQKIVSGFDFSRVELLFEGRTKRVLLESFSAHSREGDANVKIRADLLLPPETTYGEKFPGFEIEGDVCADSADVVVNAELSEGALVSRARVVPVSGGRLEVDAHLAVKQVPLSTMGPLLTKSGIVKGEFRPRFLWLDCEAAIKGVFQGLLEHNPLRLHRCLIQGNGAKMSLETALRHPDGKWDPFAVVLENVELKRMLETFGARSIDGIVSDQGRVSGKIDVFTADHARFKGQLKGLQARFSSQSVQAYQLIESIEARAETRGRHLTGAVEQAKLGLGGEFEGSVAFEFQTDTQDGEIRADIKRLVLDPSVQRLLVGGRVESLDGDAVFRYKKGELEGAKGRFDVKGLHGAHARLERASVTVERVQAGDGDFVLGLQAPKMEINRQSVLMGPVRAVFFDHKFEDEWVVVRETALQARVLGDGGVFWERAQGALEDGRIRVSSSGYLGKGRERAISGEVSVDYPSVKKLRWIVAGHLGAPMLIDHSKSLEELRAKPRIDDAVLGLPVADSSMKSGKGEAASKDASSLREIGEKMMRGARRILPRGEPAAENEKPAQ